MPSINSARVLFLATDGYERSELRIPLEKLQQHGATATIASLKSDPIKSWDEKNWGDTLDVDILVEEARIEDFDALLHNSLNRNRFKVKIMQQT